MFPKVHGIAWTLVLMGRLLFFRLSSVIFTASLFLGVVQLSSHRGMQFDAQPRFSPDGTANHFYLGWIRRRKRLDAQPWDNEKSNHQGNDNRIPRTEVDSCTGNTEWLLPGKGVMDHTKLWLYHVDGGSGGSGWSKSQMSRGCSKVPSAPMINMFGFFRKNGCFGTYKRIQCHNTRFSTLIAWRGENDPANVPDMVRHFVLTKSMTAKWFGFMRTRHELKTGLSWETWPTGEWELASPTRSSMTIKNRELPRDVLPGFSWYTGEQKSIVISLWRQKFTKIE